MGDTEVRFACPRATESARFAATDLHVVGVGGEKIGPSESARSTVDLSCMS